MMLSCNKGLALQGFGEISSASLLFQCSCRPCWCSLTLFENRWGQSFSKASFKLTDIVCNSWHKSNMIKNVICLSPMTANHFQNKVSWCTPACAKVTLAGCLQWHSLKLSTADQSSCSWQVESDNMLGEHTVCFNGNKHQLLFNVF